MSQMPRALEIRNIKTGEVARSVDVSDRSDREIETIMRGMLRNMGDWTVGHSEFVSSGRVSGLTAKAASAI